MEFDFYFRKSHANYFTLDADWFHSSQFDNNKKGEREREREREEAVSLLLDTLSVVCKWVNLCVSVFVYQKGFYECTLESAEFVIDDQEDTDWFSEPWIIGE